MTTSWRVARSLLTLRDQVNATHGLRAKGADGTIGDAAHAASVSDHNPDRYGIVRALDVTNDPDDHDGDPTDDFDAGALAEQLRASRDPRIKYVIWNRRIFSSSIAPWTWRAYTGTDPHTNHVHISVVADDRADNPKPWQLSSTPTTQEDEVTPDDIKAIAKAAADEVWTRRVEDYYGADTTTGAAQGLILRQTTATLLEDRAGRTALLAAVKAGQQAGPDADAAAIVDELASRLAPQEVKP